MNRASQPRWLWPTVKCVLALAVLAAVGWVFAKNLALLPREDIAWQPHWLALAGVWYVVGVAFSAVYWWCAMRALGQRPRFLATLRAYYIGHLGKYVPGKALVIIIRAALIQGPGVRTSAAALTVVYETLTCMAAGALLAALLLALRFQRSEGRLGQVLLLVLVALLPTLPWVFNPLVQRLTARFRQADAEPLPPLRVPTLLAGLGLGGASWLFLGASLWATVRAVQDYPFDGTTLLDCIAFIAIATVAAFFTPLPGGLGAREGALMLLLEPTLGPGPATLVAVLLRLSWIVTEVVVSAILYPLPYTRWCGKTCTAEPAARMTEQGS